MVSLDRRTSVIIGVILGQLLRDALPNPEYVALIADYVERKWAERVQEFLAAGHLLAQIAPLPMGEPEAKPWPDERTALHRFVDEFTWAVEGRQDLPDDVRARVWLAYAVKLAPTGHPIHNSEAVKVGPDPGVGVQQAAADCYHDGDDP